MSTQEKKTKLKQHCMSIPIYEGCMGCELYPYSVSGRGCVPSLKIESDIDLFYDILFGKED